MDEKEIKKENTSDGSQIYIGTPAGVVLCVDGIGDVEDLYDIDAYLWHRYSPDAIRVTSPEHMLDAMEDLFDLINYPRATTTLRSFAEEGGGHPHDGQKPGTPLSVQKHLTDSDMLQKRGKLATFIIRVQQRANSSWQGRITWVEKDRTLKFRSIIEMVKLIESALESALMERQ